MKEENKITISQEIKFRGSIFETSPIRERIEKCLKDSEESFMDRYEEIMSFLKMKREELPEEIVKNEFLNYFCNEIANEATEKAFSATGNYNVANIALSQISSARMQEAIKGKSLIDAFGKLLNENSKVSYLDVSSKGNKIILLRQEYLGEKIPAPEAWKME